MKRIMIFTVAGLVLFVIGIFGGLYFEQIFGIQKDPQFKDVPGPTLSLGDFTSNIIGAVSKVVNFNISLELLNLKTADVLTTQNWVPRIRSEILFLVKDKVYEDMTKSEGIIIFAEQIKRMLNSILPTIDGNIPVVRVLFDSFLMQ